MTSMRARLSPEHTLSAQQKGLSQAAEDILADLRALIADLGRDGGLANGSVYDTAMVVRLAPPEEGTDAAVEWLLRQQHDDGGWDNPKVVRARDMPTLAAVLALLVRGGKDDQRVREAVKKGVAFLRSQSSNWTVLPEDLLVGVEMNLLRLLDDARELGLAEEKVLRDQYAVVIKDGAVRRERFLKLDKHKLEPGTPPALTWDGWGKVPEPVLVDPNGGVGPSPAATAAWIHAVERSPDLKLKEALKEKVGEARKYLKKAEAGTDVHIPGVVPATWPIDLMEQQWGLFALLCAGLLDNPLLAETAVVKGHLENLANAFTKHGIGFTKYFMADGDSTAVTLALLKAGKRTVDISVLERYGRQEHFYTYPQETHPSLTTTAHAVMALNIAGHDTKKWVDKMLELRSPDGRWMMDKWQTSWLYTTSQAMLAIPDSRLDEMRTSIETLLSEQKDDGGWGSSDHTTTVETAYAVLVLLRLRGKGLDEERIRGALKRARSYLSLNYRPMHENREPMWIGKALYCPFRMDRAFELSAKLALELAEL